MRDRLKSIIWFAAAFLVVTTIAIAATLWKLRQDVIDDTLADTQNLASILARQADNSAQAVGLVIEDLMAEAARQMQNAPEAGMQGLATQSMYHFMRERLSRLPQADVIAFADATGTLVNNTRAWPVPDISVKERDYFIHHSTRRDPELFVSQPVKNKMTAAWTTYFTKRIESDEGHFLGVILIGVQPELFTNAFSVLSSKHEAQFSLARSDGIVLSSYPLDSNHAGSRMFNDSPWHGVKASGGVYRETNGVEGGTRLVAIEPLKHFPLVVNATVSEDAALRVWHMRASVIVAGSVALAFALILLLRALFNHLTSLAQSEHALRLVNMRFDATIANLSTGLALCDADERVVLHNEAFTRIWNNGTQSGIEALRPLLTEARFMRATEGPGAHSIDTVCKREDGHSIRVTLDSMPDGGWVTTHEDITDQVEAKARIAYLARHDALTGLTNRITCTERLAELIVGKSDFALMLIDIDNFKQVNDTFGHDTGDELLMQVARCLKTEVGTQGNVARWGGDEFVVLMPIRKVTANAAGRLAAKVLAAKVLAAKLVAAINQPVLIRNREIVPAISLGLVIGNGHFDTPEDVMRCADLALYATKAKGRNGFALFEPEMDAAYRLHQQQTMDLRKAIQSHALHVDYQPIVDARSGRIVSMEALARWTHPKNGPISPVVFIPIAEESGQINDLGLSILRTACAEAMAWPEHITVAVNVSGVQMAHSGFVESVAQTLRDTGLPAGRLELEITETVFLSDGPRALAVLNKLRAMGVRISLDDFGTGYSSLGYLHRFPFDKLKIDKSFIDNVTNDSGCTAIISATLALAREFNIVSVAEGVETAEQRDVLRAGGVNQIQGYLYGRPARSDVWLRQDCFAVESTKKASARAS